MAYNAHFRVKNADIAIQAAELPYASAWTPPTLSFLSNKKHDDVYINHESKKNQQADNDKVLHQVGVHFFGICSTRLTEKERFGSISIGLDK